MLCSRVRGPRCLPIVFLSFPFSFRFPLHGRQFHTVECDVTNCVSSASAYLFFLGLIQSSFPAQSVAILSQTFPRLCHLHLCFLLVWLHGSSFIIFVCVDCHHLVLLRLKTLFKLSITALVLSSHTHPMARHILSAISSYRKGKRICTHIFLAVLHVLDVSSVCLFEAEKADHSQLRLQVR